MQEYGGFAMNKRYKTISEILFWFSIAVAVAQRAKTESAESGVNLNRNKTAGLHQARRYYNKKERTVPKARPLF